VIIGYNFDVLSKARDAAIALNYNTLILSSLIEGEASIVAGMHMAVAHEILRTGNPLKSPACILSGGETTVTLKGAGRGGRNQEFALAAAVKIGDAAHIVVLSAGTDGTDGPTDAAGAFVDNNTAQRAVCLGLDLQSFLAENDSYSCFEQLGDLYKTDPTNTNVMDLRIFLMTERDDEK
jgi:glycerate 2-kinase